MIGACGLLTVGLALPPLTEGFSAKGSGIARFSVFAGATMATILAAPRHSAPRHIIAASLIGLALKIRRVQLPKPMRLASFAGLLTDGAGAILAAALFRRQI